MLIQVQPAIVFPFPDPPAAGELREVAPGVLWLRLPLPFLLDHVNIYLVEDEGGWAAIDTGLGSEACKAAWNAVLPGHRLTRVIATHFHPDHLGLVGWLHERFGVPLLMSRTEFLFCVAVQKDGFAANRDFYLARGLNPEATEAVVGNGHAYLRATTGLPTQVQRLRAGQTLRIGGRDFEVLTGGGHAPEQVMLYAPADRLFFSADQVMTRISPNISVHAVEPRADPLGEYLDSMAALGATIAPDTLVLPGHHLPFTGVGIRTSELAAHHAGRCALIAAACRTGPKSPAELLPVLFKRAMDPHQTGFAFGEVVAHTNYMLQRGQLAERTGGDGVVRLETSG